MKRLYNTFSFVGELGFPNDMSTFIIKNKNKNETWENIKANGLTIKKDNGNMAFLNMEFGRPLKQEIKIFSLDVNGGKLEIPFSERLNLDIVSRVCLLYTSRCV